VFGVVLAGVAVGGVRRGVVEPGPEYPLGVGGAEVVDQVAQPQHAAGPQHPRDPVQGQRLPEVRQLVQRVAGVHAVGKRRGMLIAEEARAHAVQVGQPCAGGTLAQHREHGRRDVHGRHVSEPAGGGERELPGARAQVHDGGGRTQAAGRHGLQVLGRVGVALLPDVTGHEGRIQVLGSRVRQFVDHP
jgi:hypothetical protein